MNFGAIQRGTVQYFDARVPLWRIEQIRGEASLARSRLFCPVFISTSAGATLAQQ
jgi:hypothetical protein